MRENVQRGIWVVDRRRASVFHKSLTQAGLALDAVLAKRFFWERGRWED
jgi:hypothetical protein